MPRGGGGGGGGGEYRWEYKLPPFHFPKEGGVDPPPISELRNKVAPSQKESTVYQTSKDVESPLL